MGDRLILFALMLVVFGTPYLLGFLFGRSVGETKAIVAAAKSQREAVEADMEHSEWLLSQAQEKRDGPR